MRVTFDLESEAGIRQYSEFIERAADLVIAYGGSLSGEHGDGQSRAALLPKMFGPELVQAFERLDRKSTRLNSSHANISYAVFCLKKKKKHAQLIIDRHAPRN